LGLDRLRGEINIKLGQTLDGESFGLCWGDRQEAEIHIATKQWGNPINRENKLKTLAHELTHAHQYLTGALKCDLTNEEFKSVWHKKEYRYLPDEEADLPRLYIPDCINNSSYHLQLNQSGIYQWETIFLILSSPGHLNHS
jgi:hypothetical protein